MSVEILDNYDIRTGGTRQIYLEHFTNLLFNIISLSRTIEIQFFILGKNKQYSDVPILLIKHKLPAHKNK